MALTQFSSTLDEIPFLRTFINRFQRFYITEPLKKGIHSRLLTSSECCKQYAACIGDQQVFNCPYMHQWTVDSALKY